jgi:hypothetical protein
VQLVLFPGVRDRELVSPRAVYGTPWRDVTRISWISDARLDIAIGDRVHSFDRQMPAFRDVALIAREAAAKHSISVRGGSRFALPSGEDRY